MSCVQEIHDKIQSSDLRGFTRLWQQFCNSNDEDPSDLMQILSWVRESRLEKSFGPEVELCLPLWATIEDSTLSFDTLRLIVDLQTTNSSDLAEITLGSLKQKYGTDKLFAEKIRLIGLRKHSSFHGAIRNYELLSHIEKGKAVFHNGGWGVGEILEVSLVREELIAEFDLVEGVRHVSFANAFKYLSPLPKEHFLARRFMDADNLERLARTQPAEVIVMMLKDLGPQTSADIKNELMDLIIPEGEWTKWWQNCRSKLKKDTRVIAPDSLKEPFALTQSQVTHADKFAKILGSTISCDDLILTASQIQRDYAELLKDSSFKSQLFNLLRQTAQEPSMPASSRLQLLFLQSELLPSDAISAEIKVLAADVAQPTEFLEQIQAVAFKKRTLVAFRAGRSDWSSIFLSYLDVTSQATLREYMVKELMSPQTANLLHGKMAEVLQNPIRTPELFLWFFNRIAKHDGIPFGSTEGQRKYFEGFLLLIGQLDRASNTNSAFKDLIKRMTTMVTHERYQLVRKMFEESELAYVQEIILLASKSLSFTDHDKTIIRSLAEVAHPSLRDTTQSDDSATDGSIIWTTQASYERVQSEIRQLATVDAIDVAKEIEEARAHGDLRENAEYKSALERKAMLQNKLRSLSTQANKAQVLTQDQIVTDKVSVGTKVALEASDGQQVEYTVLGPWDANPDKHILSFQSQLAKAMLGTALGETFEFQGKEYAVKSITCGI